MHRDKRNTLTGDSETCLLGQVLIAWALVSYFDLVWFGYISWEMATRLFEILLKELIHKAHLFGIRLHCMFWFTKTYESSTFESGYNCGARKNWIISDLFWQSDHPFLHCIFVLSHLFGNQATLVTLYVFVSQKRTGSYESFAHESFSTEGTKNNHNNHLIVN